MYLRFLLQQVVEGLYTQFRHEHWQNSLQSLIKLSRTVQLQSNLNNVYINGQSTQPQHMRVFTTTISTLHRGVGRNFSRGGGGSF